MGGYEMRKISVGFSRSYCSLGGASLSPSTETFCLAGLNVMHLTALRCAVAV
jgi:hypothetical protein